ncbi:hypothetical protein IW261DRAFT_455137 [Armillaria novae-zelandiae]|uniref:DUF6593 domain-containing protein n=1 Tax=Armillaria novae-zelandiae TaxID=153914 RepID=A0AA39P1C4_9AGAR|nr:hypothetical protein IW261DRAFT_455137 [Armillaria novae-zelandiae]
MNFYQTGTGLLDNSYANEAGQVIYKVSTPNKYTDRVTTISHIIPSDREPPREEDTDLGGAQSEEVDFRDRFAILGVIDWKVKTSSIMRYKGKEIKASDYLKKKGWGWYTKNRVFEGPDGKEYTWKMTSTSKVSRYNHVIYHTDTGIKLFRNDGSDTPIAKWHIRNRGLFNPAKAKPAYLEIFPEGEHMVDDIFFTFIYVEKIRKENERAAATT